jgi:hypothetical protein
MGSAGAVSMPDLYGVAGVPVALAVGCTGTVIHVLGRNKTGQDRSSG